MDRGGHTITGAAGELADKLWLQVKIEIQREQITILPETVNNESFISGKIMKNVSTENYEKYVSNRHLCVNMTRSQMYRACIGSFNK